MKAKKFFFILLGALLLSILGIAGAFVWSNGQLEAETTQIADLKADRDVTQEAILSLNKAISDSKDVDSLNTLLDRLLPLTKEQDKLVADVIYTASAEAGIPFNQVQSFSFIGSAEPNNLSGTAAAKAYPGVYEYPFSLDISGIDYATLIRLLEEIESNGRIVQVENIQITPNNGLLDVTLSMKAYLKP